MNEIQIKLASIARGSLEEQFNYELKRVLENIYDPNTEPEKKRKITIEMVFTPDDEREIVKIACKTKSVLVTARQINSKFVLGKHEDGSIGASEFVSDIPGQLDLCDIIPDDMKELEQINKDIYRFNKLEKIKKMRSGT
jgi:hypothetical protein